MQRRDFLKTGLAATSLAAAQTNPHPRISIVLPPSDPLAASAPVRWAAGELERALVAAGVTVSQHDALQQTAAGELAIVAGGKKPGIPMTAAPESLAIAAAREGGRSVVYACGHDVRGVVYALLELADRARYSADPAAALAVAASEQPLNPVRSITRLFVSDVEDKPWFNDREMWPAYLTMLATQRFNRFSLALSIGYDFLREVTDAYFLFPYPFLLTVPGYDVRATNLPDAERNSNLAMLKFISEQTVARGLDFQLGLWMHGYQWINSPKANHVIEGLTAETHGPYCRAALTALLKACPAISGVTFRIHGESGVAEGSYDFWKIVFEGVQNCGRTVAIDMHSKGIDQGMIDVGLATGMPITVSPKYWAEHNGMPYHQADIRDPEIPKGRTATGLMALSAGSRSFTRYGVADLLREDRRYSVVHRIWPGTQRMLLWGDPQWTSAYSRAFTFCGSKGVEICEPLSFKGRRGSGLPLGRCAYADAGLKTRWDWEKFQYTYRVWGRLLYDPEAKPDQWNRALRHEFGGAAPKLEGALANSSRILPIITTAHMPSAANNNYWPEMYSNQPVVDVRKNKYSDTPSPKVFGNVTPLDPQLFARVNDFADELLKGERNGKYSPVEVAAWLEDRSEAARLQLKQAGAIQGPAFRRMAIDIGIEAGTGAFFAAKLRAGVLYRIHDNTGDRHALEEAISAYRKARAAWAGIVEATRGVYVSDVTVGELPWLRGNWADRLPAIDDDIADMEKRLDGAKASDHPRVVAAIGEAMGRPQRLAGGCTHQPPARFQPNHALELAIRAEGKIASARLYYRHVNQAERFESAAMQGADGRYTAAIPAAYTGTQFPLQYYFEFQSAPDSAWLYPGFNAGLDNQPYFVVRRAS